MKRIIALTLLFIFVLGASSCFASTDTQIVKKYCHKHYKNCKIIYLSKYNEKKITTRKGKNIVYVEIVTSKSSGKKDPCNGKYWGYLVGSNYYKMWYNKKVPKGKKVKSYCIYNPYTNYEDDIVAVIDNKKIR